MFRGLSLANKCLLLFGAALVFIVAAALSIPALRLWRLVDDSQIRVSRDLVELWIDLDAAGGDVSGERASAAFTGGIDLTLDSPNLDARRYAGIDAQRVSIGLANRFSTEDAFYARALAAFTANPTLRDYTDQRWEGLARKYDFIRAERSPRDNTLRSLVVLRRTSLTVFPTLWISAIFFLVAGAAVLMFAILVFYFITRQLILRPVLSLKETAERVREGNVAVRSDISTGDEFEQLAQTFNMMLTDLQTNQERLRALNQAMDVKLHEMAERNTLLHEATRLKGEFLANVSHELRTPLNSIIGFAELLLEQVKSEIARDAERHETALLSPSSPPPAPLARRLKYLSNIDTAGRNLLTQINLLLEMARIEAGKINITLERVVLRDFCEGLAGLIHPLAERRAIDVVLEVAEDLPPLTTDRKKLQQIIFNFLSNAVKFSIPAERSGKQPTITLRAEKLPAARPDDQPSIRLSVIDNGPGIPEDEQSKIFEKFYQVDASHTKESTGTGLGLAICRELATTLQCEIQLVSHPGRGSMFSLIIPVEMKPDLEPQISLEAKFRAALAAGKQLA
jgi:two-component system sensor histidine kinase BarA